MNRDIDRIIQQVKQRQPTVLAEQLAPSHPGSDEDGLWFFRIPGTAGEVAIAWTLKNPAVTGAIVGMRNAEQVDGVVGAAALQLSEADAARIDAFRKG